MGSTRYPGKMMEDIAGRPFLERVLLRAEAAWAGIPGGGEKILAIPEKKENDPMKVMAEARGWRVHRGSEEDVLGRFASALRAFQPRAFIRICGDCPLTEPETVHRVTKALESADVALTVGYPQGFGAEGATTRALLEADREATEPYDREHVMPWIYRQAESGRFRLETPSTDRHPWTRRLTVDTAEDVAFFRGLFAALGDNPTTEEIFAFPGVRV